MLYVPALVYRIEAQYGIRAQGEKFSKIINAQYEISAQVINKGKKTSKVKKTTQVDFF